MRVINQHERTLRCEPRQLGQLLDGLASTQDPLWPRRSWPRMRLDPSLSVGAAGGHGPIRYTVETYTPGQSVQFRFTGPKGFNGYHRLEVIAAESGQSRLRHDLQMQTHGLAIISWPLLFQPLHNALIEDALSHAEAALGLPVTQHPWTIWVRILRWLLTAGKAPAQTLPTATLPAPHENKA